MRKRFVEGGDLRVFVYIGINMGARVLFVHVVGARLEKMVEMFWLGVGIQVGV